MMAKQSGGGGLPSDFQPVEWISNNNTASYFDTGYTFQKTDRVEIVASRSANKQDQALVQSTQFSIFQGGNILSNKYGVALWSRSYSLCLNDYLPAINEVVTVMVDIPNMEFKIKDTIKTITNSGSGTTTSSLSIFSNGVYYGWNQIKSVKIWDSSSNLVVEAIAGYIKSTSEIVFYDTVSQTYLHNLGTGSLIKGADV